MSTKNKSHRYMITCSDKTTTLLTSSLKNLPYWISIRIMKDSVNKSPDSQNPLRIRQVVAELLKDTGIKTKIVKEYLPVINQLTNKYLQVLDFSCRSIWTIHSRSRSSRGTAMSFRMIHSLRVRNNVSISHYCSHGDRWRR